MAAALDQSTVRALNAINALSAATYGVSTDAIFMEKKGRPDEAKARQMAIYLARCGLGLKTVEVAGFYKRALAMIPYSCERVEDRRDCPAFDLLLDGIEKWARSLREPVDA